MAGNVEYFSLGHLDRLRWSHRDIWRDQIISGSPYLLNSIEFPHYNSISCQADSHDPK